MKRLLFLVSIMALLMSCAVTLPLQTNISDNVLLMSKNKDIKVNYEVSSDIKDGFISYKYEFKNGTKSEKNQAFKYASETGLKTIWKNYFESKFNNYSTNEMDVKIRQTDFYLREQSTTSMGLTMLTGNLQSVVEAHSTIKITIAYKGKTYQKDFDIVSNSYQESQQMKAGGIYYTKNYQNPTAQKSQLIQDCYNKGIVLFENFITSIL
ncbi:MAG: hypothetical protein Q7T72_02940 [Bacteroidales bacterium]|nr:hypothetical protein [Bacteroidales bacterium]